MPPVPTPPLVKNNDTTAQVAVPQVDLDPFCEAFLSQPYAFHQELRDAGPIIILSKYDIFAMARYKEVSDALKDWQTFSSARGVGLTDFAKETPWRPPSLLLETDPPLHEKTRAIVGRTVNIAALNALRPQWVAESCKRINLHSGGFGMGIFAAADAGEITEDEAERLVRSFLTAGVDTTVNGIANMIAAFATHPGQWQVLKENPGIARRAFDEVLRWDSTVQTFFRTTTRAVDVGGITLPEGSKVLLFLAAANHDPRQWENPEIFDLQRRVLAHVGFGAGIHACIGKGWLESRRSLS